MSNEGCPRLDCIYNLLGACHHALRPDPEGCKYYRPRPEPQNAHRTDCSDAVPGYLDRPINTASDSTIGLATAGRA